MVIKRIKEGFSKVFARGKEPVEDYIEIDLGKDALKKVKIMIRPFILRVFDDINPVLNTLREGYTVAVIDIKQLKSKDIVELKRAIAKLKKTCDALEGNIAGFGENTVIAAPSFAEIYRGETIKAVESAEKR